MDPHVDFGWLWQRCEESRWRSMIILSDLTFVTPLYVVDDVLVHTRPVVALQKTFFSLEATVVTGEMLTMSITDCRVDHGLG